MEKNKINVFWFRRDLRLEDNTGLFEAIKVGCPVLPLFIFDENILNTLVENDARVTFIHDTLQSLNSELHKHNSSLAVYYGDPVKVFKQLTENFQVSSVFTNHDYEFYAIQRDKTIKSVLTEKNIEFHTYKDQVIFEKDEVVKEDGRPYLMYTPYMRKWKENFKKIEIPVQNINPYSNNFIKNTNLPFPGLNDIGFKKSLTVIPEYNVSSGLISNYEATRNYPSLEGTSRLGVHLRFGTVSIREIIKKGIAEKNETFWNELIWREFFMQILWHFPQTIHKSFKEKYDRIEWRNNEEEFKKWCEGKTGYPLVDAGMRQLNKTGYMHNRVRMVTGSFLCKHLLIDWRWGEAYFADKLLDYEMSSNIGNWQWVAGCGVDAAPYFRIFNPAIQLKKFDKDLAYIHKWIEDFNELTYPSPMVEHKTARERCLKVYGKALE